jgi:hypothetical protein
MRILVHISFSLHTIKRQNLIVASRQQAAFDPRQISVSRITIKHFRYFSYIYLLTVIKMEDQNID